MDSLEILREWFRKLGWKSGKAGPQLQPRDILAKLLSELEKKKKLGIEEHSFIPNVYMVYLSVADHEELSPLLVGIQDQLKNKLMERIKSHRYKMLSSELCIEIRKDPAVLKNQVAVESSFLKEKSVSVHREKPLLPEKEEAPPASEPSLALPDRKVASIMVPGLLQRGGKCLTRIIEDKKTRIIDHTKATLEVLEGERKGEVISLKEGEYTFGRGKDATVFINDAEDTLSRMHFKLVVREGILRITDLDSSNGTRVNNISIEEADLRKGDIICAGKISLLVA